MKNKFYITKTVSIRHNTLKQDEKILVEESGSLHLKGFLKSCYENLELNYPKFYKMDALCKLGIIATEVLTKEFDFSENTALIFQNSASSFHTDAKHQNRLENSGKSISPAVFVYTLPNIVLGEISIKHGLKSEQAFFISEEFDAPFLHNYTTILLKQSHVESAISGWIDLDNDGYNVFLALISVKGEIPFTPENFKTEFKK